MPIQPIWIQEAVAFAAVLSAIASVFAIGVQSRNASRQIISANRQRWLDNIRNEAALILSSISAYRHHMRALIDSSIDTQNKRFSFVEDSRSALNRLRVLLDDGNESQRALFRLLQTAVEAAETSNVSDTDASAIAAEIQKISQNETRNTLRGKWAGL